MNDRETRRYDMIGRVQTFGTDIGRLIRAGMKEVNYLDAIVRNKYARTPDKLRLGQRQQHRTRPAKREEAARQDDIATQAIARNSSPELSGRGAIS